MYVCLLFPADRNAAHVCVCARACVCECLSVSRRVRVSLRQCAYVARRRDNHCAAPQVRSLLDLPRGFAHVSISWRRHLCRVRTAPKHCRRGSPCFVTNTALAAAQPYSVRCDMCGDGCRADTKASSRLLRGSRLGLRAKTRNSLRRRRSRSSPRKEQRISLPTIRMRRSPPCMIMSATVFLTRYNLKSVVSLRWQWCATALHAGHEKTRTLRTESRNTIPNAALSNSAPDVERFFASSLVSWPWTSRLDLT